MYYHNLGHYFSEVAKNSARRPALCYADCNHSYSELYNWVENLAQLLINKGCYRGDVIAIGNDKGPLTFALMLAGLRLGVAYVNIDTASPLERNARILKTSEARLLFCDSSDHFDSMQELGRVQGCEVLMLDEEQIPKPSKKDIDKQISLMSQVDGACIAYVMFTSGSTGVPKGVAVTHQNVLHFISWGQQRFNIGDEDNFANLSPMYFDNSVFDFYVGLFSGASLTPVSRELLTNPYDLVAHISNLQCTIWFSVPSLLIYLKVMKALNSDNLPSLRNIVFGGEGYPKAELKKLYDDFSDQATLVNVYGPTECTCICSAHTLGDSDFEDMGGLPTLGHLNPNFDYKILNEKGMEADRGELCLIGPNVAAGYFNDVNLTSSAFETLEERNRFMKRMYRTGDIVKLVNGMFYFLGRKDNQIKHMGYRIELEEIETALSGIDDVNQSAVIYQRDNTSYGKIIAFIASEKELDPMFIESELKQKLPSYMLPAKLKVLDSLPKNANGKVDKKILGQF